MLTKRFDFMTSSTLGVKKTTISILGTLALSMSVIAPNAFAGSIWYDKTVTVEFNKSELDAENGVETVYAMLEKRAKSECKTSTSSLYYRGENVEDCVADLMNQFIESVEIDALKAYHLSHYPTDAAESYALNTK